MAFTVQAQDGIKNLATGQSWQRGQPIAPNSLPPVIWASLVEEGAIKERNDMPMIADLTGMSKTILGKLAQIGVDHTRALLATNDEDLTAINGITAAKVKIWRGECE